jgi:hypothetical protein
MAVTGRQKRDLYLTRHPTIEASHTATLSRANSSARSATRSAAPGASAAVCSRIWAAVFQWPVTAEVVLPSTQNLAMSPWAGVRLVEVAPPSSNTSFRSAV